MAINSFLKPLLVLTIIIFTSASVSTSATSSSSSISTQELDAVIQALLCPTTYESLVCQGSDFTIWAKLLAASKTTLAIPANSTMFVPTDAAISSHRPHAPDTNRYLISSHVTPRHHLLFSQLCELESFSLLPTLVPSKTIFISSTAASSYKIDNAIITQPNIYVSSRMVVHGIDHILNTHPWRSSMPPLLRAGSVLAPTMSEAAPVAAPAAEPSS